MAKGLRDAELQQCLQRVAHEFTAHLLRFNGLAAPSHNVDRRVRGVRALGVSGAGRWVTSQNAAIAWNARADGEIAGESSVHADPSHTHVSDR